MLGACECCISCVHFPLALSVPQSPGACSSDNEGNLFLFMTKVFFSVRKTSSCHSGTHKESPSLCFYSFSFHISHFDMTNLALTKVLLLPRQNERVQMLNFRDLSELSVAPSLQRRLC